MNREVNEFVLNSQKEHTRLLILCELFLKIEEFGENWFFIANEEVGRLEKLLHLIMLIIALMMARGRYALLILAVLYLGSHFVIKKTGEIIAAVYAGKIQVLIEACQKRLNDFCQEEIQKNEIIVKNESDIIQLNGFRIKNGHFKTKLKAKCGVIDIYCLKDKTAKEKYTEQKLEQTSDYEEMYADMKKNIASTEFIQKFGVLTLAGKELECMKWLTPVCQLQMIRTPGFDAVREMHIRGGEIYVKMAQDLQRPNITLNPYEKRVIRKTFEAVEYYYEAMRRQADLAQNCYDSLMELTND